jgi:hypothetical protein
MQWCKPLTYADHWPLMQAKTIDLCNNPKTKEPKLTAARRILAEWPGLDAEQVCLRVCLCVVGVWVGGWLSLCKEFMYYTSLAWMLSRCPCVCVLACVFVCMFLCAGVDVWLCLCKEFRIYTSLAWPGCWAGLLVCTVWRMTQKGMSKWMRGYAGIVYTSNMIKEEARMSCILYLQFIKS